MINTIFLKEKIIFRQLDDELILLNLNNSCYYGLKKSGIDIFQFIENKKKCTFTQLIEYLQTIYSVETEILKRDAEKLLYEFKNEQIVDIL